MKRCAVDTPALWAAAWVVLFCPGGTLGGAEPAFAVPRGQRQLFLDDQGIAEVHRLRRTMHPPAKKGAVIRSDVSRAVDAVQTRCAPAWDPRDKVFRFWDCTGRC